MATDLHHMEMGNLDKNGRKTKDEIPEETEYKPLNWKKIFLTPKYIPFHLLAIAIGIVTILLAIRHDQAVEKLRPFGEKVRDIPAGFLIPVAILIIISFPPLFGHEIIAVLCGVVYGLWIGFAIVAAGTFLGEVGTWFAFKYALRRRAQKLERTNLNYGALARLTRDGGFWIVLIIRLSAIPAHFSTAVFSTCDVRFWSFCIATFLSLPKQIFLVYLGVLLLQGNQNNSLIKTIMFGIVFIVTIIMAVYIWWKMKGIKKILLEEQRIRKEKAAERRVQEMEKEERVQNWDRRSQTWDQSGSGQNWNYGGRPQQWENTDRIQRWDNSARSQTWDHGGREYGERQQQPPPPRQNPWDHVGRAF